MLLGMVSGERETIVPHRLAFDGLIRETGRDDHAGNNCSEVAVRGAERDESSHRGCMRERI